MDEDEHEDRQTDDRVIGRSRVTQILLREKNCGEGGREEAEHQREVHPPPIAGDGVTVGTGP
jgi:hypothetical protein